MELYDRYFEEGLKCRPYESGEEAMGDIMAMVDICLSEAFLGRDVEQERLDMRGVVITPQEFYLALNSRTLEARCGTQRASTRIRQEMELVEAHIKSRVRQSMEAERLPGIFRIIRKLQLSRLESFCFFLALVCDYDRKYERLYGYIQDNVDARMPTVGLGLSLYQGLMNQDTSDVNGDFPWIRRDSPLWIYLLKAEPWNGTCSKLSRPMAVRESVLRFLKGEPWKEGALVYSAGIFPKEKRLTVSLPGLVELAEQMKDGTIPSAPYAQVSPETMLADLAFLCKVEDWFLELSREGRAEYRDKIKRFSWVLPLLGLEGEMAEGLGLDAARVRLIYRWEDLILEESQKCLLRHICNQVAYRDVVMKEWGFERKLPYGNGVSAVFYGAPGTGKTMAAQVMGQELGQQVYRVDVSRLVSKYVGETEKNIGELFDRAREQRVILFFDEADGLFAKRSSISSSNDRYANMETSYLLQRFEEYEGVAILATNFIHNMDDAFKRRIRFFVRFTFPDRAMRKRLWQSMIPEDAPVEEPLEFSWLANQFELAGSAIKEISTNAAYLAAAEKRGIRNQDIKTALKLYFLKLGKSIEEFEC